MMYHGHGMGAGWSLSFFAVALPAPLLATARAVAQFQRTPRALEPGAEGVPADRLARGRDLARGEIEPEEYEEMATRGPERFAAGARSGR